MRWNKTLYVMCGLPGSGKSTLALELGATMHAIVLSADPIRVAHRDPAEVFAWLHAECIRGLAAGRNVIVDICALRATDRARWRAIGRTAGARCQLVIVNTPWSLCRERNRVRAQPSLVNWPRAATLMYRTLIDARLEGWDRVKVVRSGFGACQGASTG